MLLNDDRSRIYIPPDLPGPDHVKINIYLVFLAQTSRNCYNKTDKNTILKIFVSESRSPHNPQIACHAKQRKWIYNN